MKTYLPHASSFTQISANIVALICCGLTLLFGPFGFILSLILYFTEKYSGLVKYYAMFASVIWVLKTILLSILSLVNGSRLFAGMFFIRWDWGGVFFLSLLRALINILFIVILLLAVVQAYRWQIFKAPIIGRITDYFCTRGAKAAYNGDGPVPPFAGQRASAEGPAHGNPTDDMTGSLHGKPPPDTRSGNGEPRP